MIRANSRISVEEPKHSNTVLLRKVLALTSGQKLEAEVLESLIGQLEAAPSGGNTPEDTPAMAGGADAAAARSATFTASHACETASVEQGALAVGALSLDDDEEGEEPAAEAPGPPPPPPLTEREVAQLRGGLAKVQIIQGFRLSGFKYLS